MGYAPKYSEEQKEAVASAVVDRGLAAPRVAELASAGALPGTKDELAPFTIPVASVRHYARVMRRRRAGKTESELLALEPKDAVERVRRRLLAMIDGEMTALENLKAGKLDLERIRQIARASREVAALPGPGDPRPAKPGARKEGGVRTEGATRTPMAAGILADIGGGEPPQNDPQHTHVDGEGQGRSAASTERTAQEQAEAEMDGLPGSLALALDTR